MILQIDMSDEKIVGLAAKPRAHGLSSEEYARQVLEDHLESGFGHRPIWELIVENMKRVPAEDMALLPRDGASQDDHYIYGGPKREL
jgi:plasmid stability protein